MDAFELAEDVQDTVQSQQEQQDQMPEPEADEIGSGVVGGGQVLPELPHAERAGRPQRKVPESLNLNRHIGDKVQGRDSVGSKDVARSRKRRRDSGSSQ